MAGVVALVEHATLHKKCAGCDRADWDKDRCKAIKWPSKMWAGGYCWSRNNKILRAEREELQTQFQQARCPGMAEDLIGWLMATKPPSIRDREPILHLPAPPAKSGGSKNKRKRKMPKASVFYNPYL